MPVKIYGRVYAADVVNRASPYLPHQNENNTVHTQKLPAPPCNNLSNQICLLTAIQLNLLENHNKIN
jgi:hypothetical protein